MPRGVPSPVGTETTNANGYTQVKTADRGWIGKHVLLLEKQLGRKLALGERAIFKDGDQRNCVPENIQLSIGHKKQAIAARIARLKAEIKDRQEWIIELEKELEQQV